MTHLLLALGSVVRVITFLFLDPKNNDPHYLVLDFITRYGRLPQSLELGQSYHPPLYYLLSWPLYHLTRNVKMVQVLSLIFSLAILWMLYHLIYRTKIISNITAQNLCFIIACFSPQFIMFSLYLSNDTLAILLGCAIALSLIRYINSADGKTLAILALVTSLGLLTKATFLAYLPVIVFTVWFVTRFFGRHSTTKSLITATAFLTAVVALGGYKYLENYRYYGNPIVSNLDSTAAWSLRDQESHRGIRSYFDVNLISLLASPSISESTKGAYPLLLYATFWHQHIPESSFRLHLGEPFRYLGSMIYAFAVIPTIVGLAGLIKLAGGLPGFLRDFRSDRYDHRIKFGKYAVVALFLSNVGLLFAAVSKYHVYSIMQGRLLFPTMFGSLVAFGVGVEAVSKNVYMLRVLRASLVVLTGLFLTYLGTEIWFLFTKRMATGDWID